MLGDCGGFVDAALDREPVLSPDESGRMAELLSRVAADTRLSALVAASECLADALRLLQTLRGLSEEQGVEVAAARSFVTQARANLSSAAARVSRG